MAGVLMYLVCLSGTLAVFYEEFERWEQPYVEEFPAIDADTVDRTFNDWIAGGVGITPYMYFVMPTPSVPRARVATEKESWYVNGDGSIGAAERNNWTEMLLDLHLYLHLPETWGMILVSALGAMLCALIVSGLVAHPRIFRDAFNLRLKGSRHLEQADIHNRLSVWGVPFHLMIAVTGAYFGLALPILSVVASAFYGGDREAALDEVFGDEPVLEQQAGPLAVGDALKKLDTLAPGARPFLITAHGVGEPGQFFSISARHPGRLIYSENYRFDAAGNYLGAEGYADGAAGRQIVYSLYRLHFGHFGGLAVKLAYGLLGLALTVVSVTGVNVWLARRRTRDWLNNAWSGFVWGAPPALALSAIADAVFRLPGGAVVFWCALAAAVALCLWLDDAAYGARVLKVLAAGLLALLVVTHALRFEQDAVTSGALGVNVAIAACALVFAWMARKRCMTAPRGRTGMQPGAVDLMP